METRVGDVSRSGARSRAEEFRGRLPGTAYVGRDPRRPTVRHAGS